MLRLPPPPPAGRRRSDARPARRPRVLHAALRPPPALAEDRFLGAACVVASACAPARRHNLKLSTAWQRRGRSNRHTYFDARDIPRARCAKTSLRESLPTGRARSTRLKDIATGVQRWAWRC